MPARQNHVGGDFYDPWIRTGLKMASLQKVVTADEPLLASYPPVLYLDPGGAARTVLLPPEGTSAGLTFFIRNIAGGAHNLVVEEDSSTTAIVTLSQNTQAVLHCDGTAWRRIA